MANNACLLASQDRRAVANQSAFPPASRYQRYLPIRPLVRQARSLRDSRTTLQNAIASFGLHAKSFVRTTGTAKKSTCFGPAVSSTRITRIIFTPAFGVWKEVNFSQRSRRRVAQPSLLIGRGIGVTQTRTGPSRAGPQEVWIFTPCNFKLCTYNYCISISWNSKDPDLMRYVLFLAGACLIGQATSYGWSWCSRGADYPASIVVSQSHLSLFIGCMTLLGSGLIAAGIASGKQARLEGFLCGLFGGPLGVVGALWLDNRPKCPQCSGRLHSTATYCPHCQSAVPASLAPLQPEVLTNPDELQKSQYSEVNQNHTDWMAGRTTATKSKTAK